MHPAQEEHDHKSTEELRSIYTFKVLDHRVLRPLIDMSFGVLGQLLSSGQSVWSCRAKRDWKQGQFRPKDARFELWAVTVPKGRTRLPHSTFPFLSFVAAIQSMLVLSMVALGWQSYLHDGKRKRNSYHIFTVFYAIGCDPSVHFEKSLCHNIHSL